MNSNFWKEKRVLLTGHTGFKGSWLSLWLQHLGAELTGYALKPPTEPNLFNLANVANKMKSIEGDVRELNHLNEVIYKYKPEIVIHMAAQPLVRLSYQEPVETYATNVMGTVNLLESVRRIGCVKTVLIVTSDKCYENREWVWGYREDEPMGGFDPYSSSKGCSELVTSAYRRSFFQGKNIAVATARAGNVIGGGDFALDRIIPDIFRGILENRTIKIRNPQATRPWQHVLEPLSGYMLLIEKLFSDPNKFSESWNFGPAESDCKPVSFLVETIASSWEGSIKWEIEEQKNLHEAGYLKLDCSKAKTRLNWTPRWNIERAIEETIIWYKEFEKSKNKIKEFSISQINSYAE